MTLYIENVYKTFYEFLKHFMYSNKSIRKVKFLILHKRYVEDLDIVVILNSRAGLLANDQTY